MTSVSSSSHGGNHYRNEQAEFHLILYTIFGKHRWSAITVYIGLFFDLWQIATLVFDNDTPWAAKPGQKGQPALDYFDIVRNPFFLVKNANALRVIILVVAAAAIALWLMLIYVYRRAGERSVPWAEAILRNTARVILSGLYMPVMVALILPFKCGNDAKWKYFPDIMCNTGEHAAIIGLSVFGIILMLPFIGLIALVNVDYTLDPEGARITSSRDGRYSVINLGVKIALGVMYSLNVYAMFNQIFAFVCLGFLMYYTLVDMPYYNKNVMRFKIIVLLNSLIGLVGAMFLLSTNKGVPQGDGGVVGLVVVLVLWIPGTALAWFVVERRYGAIKRRADLLCDAVAKWRDVEDGAAGMDASTGTRTPERDLDVSVWLPYSFVTPSEVLPCILQFIHSPDENERKKAVDILAVAQKQFPRDANIMNLRANYLLNIADNANLSVMTARKASKSASYLDILFLSRALNFDAVQQLPVELGGNGGMDMLSFVTYHVNLSEAIRLHRIALHRSQEFWKVLNTESPDLKTVADLVWTITQAETRAEELYVKLVKKYPTARPLLFHYSRFLLHMKHDDRLANEYAVRAERLDVTRFGTGTDDGNNSRHDDDRSSVDGRSQGAGRSTRIRTRPHAIPSPRSAKTDDTGGTGGTAGREKYVDRRSDAHIIQKNPAADSIDRAGYIICGLVMVGITFSIIYYALTSTGYKAGLEGLNDAAQRCEHVQRPLLLAHQLHESCVSNNTVLEASLRKTLSAFIVTYRQALQDVRAETFQASTFAGGGKDVDAIWTNTNIPVVVTTSAFGETVVNVKKQMTFWDASNSLLDAATNFVGLPASTLANEALMPTEPNFRFLLDNTWGPLTTDCPTLTGAILQNLNGTLSGDVNAIAIVTMICFFLLVFVSCVRVRTAIDRAHREHISAINLFFELPRGAVAAIYARTVAVATESNGFNSDASSGSFGSSYGSSHSNGSSSSISEEAMMVGARSQSLVNKLRMQRYGICVTLLTIFILFIVIAVVTVPAQRLAMNAVQDLRSVASNVRAVQQYLIEISESHDRHVPIDVCDAQITVLTAQMEATMYAVRLGTDGIDTTGFYVPEMYAGSCDADDGCVPIETMTHSRKGLFGAVALFIELARQRLGPEPTFDVWDIGHQLDADISILVDGCILPHIEMIIKELQTDVATQMSVGMICVAFLYAIAFIYNMLILFIIFPRMSNHLRKQVAKTLAMLHMVPADIIAQIDEIKWFLTDVQSGAQTRFRNSDRTALCVMGVTAKGEIVRSFRGLTETLGYRANALDGESVHELFPDLFAMKATDNGKKEIKFVKALQPMLETKLPRAVYDAEHNPRNFRVGAIDCRADYGDDIPYKICLYAVPQQARRNANGVAEAENVAHEFSTVIFRGAMEYSNEGFLVVDEGANVVFASAGALKLFDGSDLDELRERGLDRLFAGNVSTEGLISGFETQAAEGAEVQTTAELQGKGRRKAVRLRVASLNDQGSGAPYLLMMEPLKGSGRGGAGGAINGFAPGYGFFQGQKSGTPWNSELTLTLGETLPGSAAGNDSEYDGESSSGLATPGPASTPGLSSHGFLQ